VNKIRITSRLLLMGLIGLAGLTSMVHHFKDLEMVYKVVLVVSLPAYLFTVASVIEHFIVFRVVCHLDKLTWANKTPSKAFKTKTGQIVSIGFLLMATLGFCIGEYSMMGTSTLIVVNLHFANNLRTNIYLGNHYLSINGLFILLEDLKRVELEDGLIMTLTIATSDQVYGFKLRRTPLNQEVVELMSKRCKKNSLVA